jgi:hypothetical protein
VACKVAISQASVVTGMPDKDKDITKVMAGTANKIYARPMCLKDNPQLDTTLIVRICPDTSTLQGKRLADEGPPVWDNNSGMVKSLPSGLYGPCKF